MPLFGRHKMKEPVEGSAKVVNINSIPVASDLGQRCNLDVMIEAPGIPAYVTSLSVRVNVDRWPSRGQLLPVLIDRASPEHIEVLWDRVATFAERRKQAGAERLAQAMEAVGQTTILPPGIPATGAAGSAAQILEAGLPAQVIVQHAQPLGIRNPQGLEMYVLTLSVMIDGRDPYAVSVGNPVPAEGVVMLSGTVALPAKVLADNPQAVVIDWALALAG